MGLKKDLSITRIPVHSSEWYKFRNEKGVGGSEIATLAGDNKWQCAQRLFWNKVGIDVSEVHDNKRMADGRDLEDFIASRWEYWDWSLKEPSWFDAYSQKRKVRKCQNVNGFVDNPDLPYMFASMDKIMANGSHTYNGEELPSGGILELKRMGADYFRILGGQLPNHYIWQPQQYMLITGLRYAEVFVNHDIGEYACFPIEFNEDIASDIKDLVREFWEARVIPAKKLSIEYWKLVEQERYEAAKAIKAEIARYEPDLQDNVDQKDFINERFNALEEIEDTMLGNVDWTDAAIDNKLIKELKKEIDKYVDMSDNILRDLFRKNQVAQINLINNEEKIIGKMTLKRSKNAVNPTLRINPGGTVNNDLIETTIKRLINETTNNRTKGFILGA